MSQAEQIALFDDIPEENHDEWHSETVKRLKDYRSLKLAVEGADLHDPKDKAAIEKKRKEVQLIELALSPLSPQARKIIELS